MYPLEGRRSTIRLMQGDCIERMKEIPDGSIDLTVTSPPYDTLRSYNGNNALWGEHVWRDVIAELYRVTADGGVVVWVVGDATIKGSETGTSFKQALWAMECGFNLHDTMIWHKPNAMPQVDKSRFCQSHEYMFVWSKGKPKTAKPITAPTKNGGKVMWRGDGNAENINKRGANVVALERIAFNVVSIPVGTESNNGHPAVFPLRLAEVHILSWSNPGDTVFDPFMGSGTTGKMAKLLNRNFIGIELDPTYFDIACKRIEDAQCQVRAGSYRKK